MSLEPLTPLTIILEKSPNPGRPPSLDWLSISSLVINTLYQRPVSRSGLTTIARITAAFSWSRFSPVIVRRIPGPLSAYEIIDGQHRSKAALTLGYDRVPAMVVDATDEEAAQIFAAVNGNVTPMHPLSVYKAALAGNEPWALGCRKAASNAGCEILLYPKTKADQAPRQTMAVQAIKRVWQQHGEAVLEAAFLLLTATSESEQPGFLTSFLISRWSSILASRPGWVANIGLVRSTIRTMAVSLALEEPARLEIRIGQRIGDGRGKEVETDIKAKVAEAFGRRLSPQMIAASLRLPYAEVERIIAEIRAETPRLEAPR